MEKKVYIVHGSAIVQKGLAEILRNNFICLIKCYFDLKSLTHSGEDYSYNALFFIEDTVANSEEYLKFLDKSDGINSYSIVNHYNVKHDNNQYTIGLHDSPGEIHEQVKHEFNQQKQVQDESEGLSKREVEVLKFVALGYSNKEIAEKLFISAHTVMSHRKNMTEKLGIKSISGLTVYAIINNYIDTSNLDLKDLI